MPRSTGAFPHKTISLVVVLAFGFTAAPALADVSAPTAQVVNGNYDNIANAAALLTSGLAE